jgi:hypothetical protein
MIKSKDAVEAEVREVFWATRGRSGYSFVDCHNHDVLDRIKEVYPIIYGKDDAPKSKLISKEFARKIVAEVGKRKGELGWICSLKQCQPKAKVVFLDGEVH